MYHTLGLTLCRLCLCSGGRLRDVFVENDNLEFMVDKTLEELLQLKVTKDSAYPWLVCYHCIEKLKEFRLFKHRCLEAQFVFLNRIENGNFHKNWKTGLEAKHLQEDSLDVSDANELTREDTQGGCSAGDDESKPGSAWQNGIVMEAIIALDHRGNDEIFHLSSRDADKDPVNSAGCKGLETRAPLEAEKSLICKPEVNDLASSRHLENEPEIFVVTNDEMEIGVKDESLDLSGSLTEEVTEGDDFNVLQVSRHYPFMSGVPFEEVGTDIYSPAKKVLDAKEEYVVDQPQGPQADSFHYIPARLCSQSDKNKSWVSILKSSSTPSVTQDDMRNELADKINTSEGKKEESVINLVSSTIDKGVTLLPSLPRNKGGKIKKIPHSQRGGSKESNINSKKMCKLCGKKFSVIISLKKHMYEVHLGVKRQSYSFSVGEQLP